ncbi:MAG: hypothetical protein AAF560_17165 [Acidobacteriota bacterium]
MSHHSSQSTTAAAVEPAAEAAPPTRRRLNRLQRLVNRAKQKPTMVLKDKRCRKPEFCLAFFDHCIDRALLDPSSGVELAELALDLAGSIGDPHLMNRAEGVRVHAYIATTEWDRASEYLEGYRASALTCCESCAADWYVRQGDLLVEHRDTDGAGQALDHSFEHLGCSAGDGYGRLCFIRGLQHFYEKDHERALCDVETALTEIELDSPRGYFVNSLAFLSCFLQGAQDRERFEQALEIADAFRARILGLKDWGEARTSLSWVEGQIHARLGNWREADHRLGRTRRNLIGQGPDRYALAAALDHCLNYTHRPSDDSRRRILGILGTCERRLTGLEPLLKKRLKHVKSVISRQPRHTAWGLTMLRRSFIVPVAAIVFAAQPR